VLLEHLYIHPTYQGKRLGAAVLACIIEESQGSEIRVTALRGSDSNRFYLRHGFLPAGHDEFDNHYVLPRKGAAGLAAPWPLE
jgi:predicted N-acetyltransferase YhbS